MSSWGFQLVEKPVGLVPQANQKFLLELFSKSSWESRGESPLVAHRSERNLLKAVAFFRGESHKQSSGLFVREGHFFAKKSPYCSHLFAALSAYAETHDLFYKSASPMSDLEDTIPLDNKRWLQDFNGFCI